MQKSLFSRQNLLLTSLMNSKLMNVFVDLTGKQFGKLTAINYFQGMGWGTGRKLGKWLCKCQCGKEKLVDAQSLKSGRTKSCGCLVKEAGVSRRNNLIGKTFGKLLVISLSKNRGSRNELMYNCLCECGNKIEVLSCNLTKNNSTSCGGSNHRLLDLTGQKFGLLTVLNLHHIKNKACHWTCKCDCGNERIIRSQSLIRGATKSCGCYNSFVRKSKIGIKNPSWTGYESISGRYFGAIKQGAKIRKLEFNITLPYIWEVFKNQNQRCALSGILLQFNTHSDKSDGNASLDRIDSLKGYVEGNVQWVHKDINQMKMDLPEEVFLKYCKIITHYQSAKTQPSLQ